MKAIKILSATALAGAAGLAAVPAQAADVRWSVHIGLPVPVVTVPLPAPVVVVPVYRTVPVHRAPAWHDRDRDGIPDWRDPYDNRRGHVHPAWRDRDRDGVPDWRDRRDNRRDDRRDDRRGGR